MAHLAATAMNSSQVALKKKRQLGNGAPRRLPLLIDKVLGLHTPSHGGSSGHQIPLLAPSALSTFRPVKIGFLGGSFDPVHFGHLMAAQDAYEQMQLDRVVLVPAAQAPLKPQEIQSSGEDRLGMLRAATAWDTRFEISDFELRRGGMSYTIDSARHFRAQYPNDQLYWIIGGDQLPQLHLWKDIAELAQLVEFVFLERPGYPAKARADIPGLRLRRCDGHLLSISSTELRERTRRNLSLHYFMPHKAIAYIEERRLYRDL